MNSLIWVFATVLMAIGATVGSIKRVNQGTEALVERLGKYHRKLNPGLNFWVFPIVDEVVVEATTREQILDIAPSPVITRDNVTVQINAVIFWRILELERTFYEIEDIQEALRNLVITTLRSEIGQMDLQETYSSRNEINYALLKSLDEATEPWGVKVTRVEVQDIDLPPSVKQALEKERAAESEKRAAIAEAEGEKQSAIRNAEAIAEAVRRIAEVLPRGADTKQILKYLVMQRYVDANLQLGESNNSKIIFMNPKDLTQGLAEIIDADFQDPQIPKNPQSKNINGGNGSNLS